MTNEELADVGARLIANGYQPIVTQGKRPVASSWQNRENTLQAFIAELHEFPSATNIGLRTGAAVGLDIDIINPDHAAAVKKLADEVLSSTPLERVGSKGMMCCYRNVTPVKKIRIAAQGAAVEILGTGQQFIAYGIHPDTGKSYEWVNSDDRGVFDPLTVPFADLPAVTSDQLRVFACRAQELLEELAYGKAKVTGDLGEKLDHQQRRAGEPMSCEILRSVVAFLEPDAPRDEWRDNIAAIRAAPIPNDPDKSERRQIALEYSRGTLDMLCRYEEQSPETYEGDEEVEKIFDSMPPRAGGITVGTIIKRARAAGYSGPISIAEAEAAARFRRTYEEFAANQKNSDKSNDHYGPNGHQDNSNDELMKLFKWRYPDEDENTPPVEFWDEEKTIPKGATIIGYGSFGCFKSTVVLADAFDATDKGAVVCMSVGEGVHGVRTLRVPATCRERGITTKDLRGKFYVIPNVPNLTNEAEISAFIKTCQPLKPDILILDTFATASGGIEENSDAIGKLLTSNGPVGRIKRALNNPTVILPHHTGKDASRGARGHSSIGGNADTMWEITADKDTRRVIKKVVKMRDGEDNFSVEYSVTPPAQVPVAKKIGRLASSSFSESENLYGMVVVSLERTGIRGEAKAVATPGLARLMLELEFPDLREEKGMALTRAQEQRQAAIERQLTRAAKEQRNKFAHLVRKLGSSRNSPWMWSLPYHDGEPE